MAVRARQRTQAALSAAALLLAACASGPPVPDWQANARSALDAAVAAHFAGDKRAEELAFTRARSEIARTGRADLRARAELMRCGARVASLEFGPCEGFEPLRDEAPTAERAYADHLAAKRLGRDDITRLPAAQQGVAAALAGGSITVAALQDIADPASRLIAIAVLFQAGRADPLMLELAVDTASAQGWRRPLLAWLEVQALRAERAGATEQAARVRRRIALVTDQR